MAVATAVLVGAGISAAASAYSAKKGSDAAKNAAQTQAAAADKATELQRQIWETGRQDTMPWLRAGQGAVSTLASLSGIPMGGPGTGGIPGPTPQPQPTPQTLGITRQPGPNAQPTGRMAQPRPGSLADVGQFSTMNLIGMRAPDGSTRFIPEGQVDFYAQRGATRLN